MLGKRSVKEMLPHIKKGFFFLCAQGFVSGLIFTGSGTIPIEQTGSMIFSRPDPDSEKSFLKMFHLFYDEF